MNVSLAILEMYPLAIPLEDFSVRYEDGVQTIYEWNMEEPRPTQEELDVAWFSHLKKAKIAELNEACNKFIASGFVSPSTQFEFEFETHDQNNLTQQAIILMNDITIPTVLWKTKNQGIQSLTREQFFIILKESEAHKRNGIGKYWQLKAQVELATTEEEIKEFKW